MVFGLLFNSLLPQVNNSNNRKSRKQDHARACTHTQLRKMVFDSNNLQLQNENLNTNNLTANPVQNNHNDVNVEDRPLFGSETLEALTGKAVIALIIVATIYIAWTMLRQCGFCPRCNKRRSHNSHRRSRHHRHHHHLDHLSDNDNHNHDDSDAGIVSDSPQSADSLAGSDVSEHAPPASPSSSAAAEMDSLASSGVSSDSGVSAPAFDVPEAAVAADNNNGSQLRVSWFQFKRSVSGDATESLPSEAVVNPAPRACSCCFALSVVLRWCFVITAVYLAWYAIFTDLIPMQDILLWLVNGFAAWVGALIVMGFRKRMSLYELGSLYSNAVYWVDWISLNWRRIDFVWGLIRTVLKWLFPCCIRVQKQKTASD